VSKKSLPDLPIESPVPFRTGSNGEFVPRPMTDDDRRAEELFARMSDDRARRLGIPRREFVQSAAGTALALAVINTVYGCGEKPSGQVDAGLDDKSLPSDSGGAIDGSEADGGVYDVDAEMTEDAGLACEELGGDEFIFDVQTHHVNPMGEWRNTAFGWAAFLRSLPQGACGEADGVDCYSTKHYLREMFINSDTTMAVLSAVPANPGENPLEIEEAAETRRAMDELAQSERLVLHGLVLPDRGQAELDGMQRLAEELRIAAWKVYTPFGGWRLDDPQIGIPFIEKAAELGVKRICAHKGLPLVGFDPNFASPDDIGVVASMFPDMQFVVYHSGYETDTTEGPYDDANPQGIDRLIKSLEDNGIAPNSNVWAELGSTWRAVMTSPDEGAHVIGKLLRYVGEDRVLWGTDSIWYGTPQDQIMAFRAFEITAAFQMMYGYPQLTREVKAKVFGLNAANLYAIDPLAKRCAIQEDDLTRVCMQYERSPSFRHYGPSSRREFFAFLRSRGGMPG
jgi:predicted TIM-barrel fold metal-dependent hydrolase